MPRGHIEAIGQIQNIDLFSQVVLNPVYKITDMSMIYSHIVDLFRMIRARKIEHK